MKTYLEAILNEYQSLGHKRDIGVLRLLLSEKPDAEKIRNWLKKNARKGIGSQSNRNRLNEECIPCTDWEADLLQLVNQFTTFESLKAWEKASGQDRFSHSKRVAKLARDLAKAIEEAPSPYYPPVLELFDEDRAANIIRALPSAELLLGGTRYDRAPPMCFREGIPDYQNASYRLAGRFSFPEPQNLPSLLRNLADYAERKQHEPKRDQRPNTGQPDARAFARQLTDDYFDLFFKRTPNEVIAACVNLKFPDIDPPPDESTIREWRGAK
ncbi:MAG: hypothetical protein LM514_01510 [Streptococcus sp.]|nr:hypothetical protein [Streptococcus sp.]